MGTYFYERQAPDIKICGINRTTRLAPNSPRIHAWHASTSQSPNLRQSRRPSGASHPGGITENVAARLCNKRHAFATKKGSRPSASCWPWLLLGLRFAGHALLDDLLRLLHKLDIQIEVLAVLHEVGFPIELASMHRPFEWHKIPHHCHAWQATALHMHPEALHVRHVDVDNTDGLRLLDKTYSIDIESLDVVT